jgi:hypothetical protein
MKLGKGTADQRWVKSYLKGFLLGFPIADASTQKRLILVILSLLEC